MSIAFVDSPGSTLPSLSEPLDFTTDRDVVAISVGFGDRRTEERVYRDGVFHWPYLRSTQAGHTFSIVRDDGRLSGWPLAPTLYVDEVAAPSIDGQPLGVIYGVDFADLPNQALSAGANVVDEKTWWVKGAFGAGDSVAIVNGAGMRLLTKQLQNLYAYATGDLTAGFSAYLDFAGQLSGYNPNAPCILQYRFEDCATAYAGNAQSWLSLYSCAEDAARPTNAQRNGLHAGFYDVSGGRRFQASYPGGGLTGYNYVATGFAQALNRSVMTIASGILRTQTFDVQEVGIGTDWPDVATSAGYQHPFPGLPLYAALPGFGCCFHYENHLGPDFPAQQYTLRAMRVLQPKVAA